MSTPAADASGDRLGPAYNRLLVASVVSALGDGIDLAALPLLAAALTRDARRVALLAVASGLPWLLFALPAGALVDRWDRRRVMWTVDAGRAALVAGLALLVATHRSHLWHLYVIAFGLGIGQTLFDNAAQAMLPAVVPTELLERANGRQYAGQVIANTFAGPRLGGLLFAAVVSLPFWLDSTSFAVSAALIVGVQVTARTVTSAIGSPPPPAPVRRSLRTEIADGIRWLRAHRLLRTLAVLPGVINFGNAMMVGVFVLFAERQLGLSARGFGVLLAAGGVGSVIGGLLGERFSGAIGPRRSLLAAIAVLGTGQVVIGLSSHAWIVGVLMFVDGVFVIVWNVVTVSLRQSIVPAEILGRVNSVYRFLGWGSLPLGSLAGGFVAHRFGLRTPIVAGGIVSLVALAAAVPRLAEMPRRAQTTPAPPSTT